MKIQTILHPTDFSRYSDNAWHMACALASDYGAQVIALHVHETPLAVYGEFGSVPPDTFDAEGVKRELANMQPTAAGIPVERRLSEGNPAAEIVRMAEENHCDLIVLGTHGRTGLGRLLMGSVAEQVMRKATCPVLVVKTPMTERAPILATEAQAATVP